MRTILMLALTLIFTACVQDTGKVNDSSVTGGTTSGSTTGTTSSGSSGGPPTDPLYVYQWHLNNTGQDVGSFVDLANGIDTTPTAGVDINAQEVHDDGVLGTGVKLVVSDTGTDYTHPDLDGNFIEADQRNYAFLDPARWDDANADAYPSGNEAHGTAVAGIISMEGWNDIGGRGVAPSSTFTAFKFILDYASADHATSDLDKTIHQLNANYDVFNFSYGFSQCLFYNDYDSDLIDALKSGVSTLRSNMGAIYVQAAGNSYDDSYCGSLSYLTYFFGNTNATASLSVPYKIVAGAVSADGIKSSYSTPGSGIWVSGFGGEGMETVNSKIEYVPAIFTTDIQDCSSGFSIRDYTYKLKNAFNYGYDTTLNSQCDYTNVMNGTSSATPIVSGVVALMLEANPSLTWRDVKYILATTAQQVDYDVFDNVLDHPLGTTYGAYVYDYKWVMNAAGFYFSNWYGFGLVDADAAVAAAKVYPSGFLGTYVRTETVGGVWNHTSAVVVPITDADVTAPASSTIAAVQSLTIEAVQVKLSTDHPYPEQLAVHLISPSGTVSRLILIDSGITRNGSNDYYFLSNAFLEEDSGGTWTIEVYDPSDMPDDDGGTPADPSDDVVVLDTGSITGWAINIHGH